MSVISQRNAPGRWVPASYSASATTVLGASIFVAAASAFLLVHRNPLSALLLVALPVGAWLLTRSYGGVVLGIALILVLPYWQTFGSAQITALRVASLAAAATLLVTRRFSARLPDYALAAFVLITVLSWLLQYNQPHAGRVISIELTPIGFYLGARAFPLVRVRLALAVALLAGTLGALTVIYEYLNGVAIFIDPSKYVWNQTNSFIFRPGGIFGSPPGASTVLSFTVLFGLALLPGLRGNRRAVSVACMAICSLALVLTFTRAAIIALAVGVLMFLWLIRSPLLRPLRVAWFATVIAAVTLALLPSLERTSTFQQGIVRPGSLSQRESYWGFGLRISTASARNALVGIGSGALEAPSAGPNAPVAAEVASSPQVVSNSLHNQYVTTLLEQGALGLVAMILFLLSVFLPSVRLARRTRDPVLSALAAGIVCMAIIMSVDTTFLHGPSFAVLMLAAGLAVNVASTPRLE